MGEPVLTCRRYRRDLRAPDRIGVDVRPARRGYGKALLKEVKEKARHLGPRHLVAHVNTHDVVLQRWFRNAGFTLFEPAEHMRDQGRRVTALYVSPLCRDRAPVGSDADADT